MYYNGRRNFRQLPQHASMRPSIGLHKSKASSSSNRWLARQSSDPYVRARLSGSQSGPEGGQKSGSKDAEESGGQHGVAAYRSRASYKLLEIWKRYPGLMRKGGKVVDLGAAPGGWSQVASQAVTSRGLVLGIDLLPIVPLEGVTFLQGDFLSHPVQEELARVLAEKFGNTGTPRKKAWWSLRKEAGEGGEFGLKKGANTEDGSDTVDAAPPLKKFRVDTVLSDMMSNISGIRDRDVANSLELCESALNFAQGCLKVAKVRSEIGDEDVESGEISEAQLRNHDTMTRILVGQAQADKIKGKDKRGRLDDGMVGGGCLVLKHFQHPDLTAFQKERLNPMFRSVKVEKPKSSRSESSEAFFVCTGFRGIV